MVPAVGRERREAVGNPWVEAARALAGNMAWWKNTHMTTTVKADHRSRIALRGVQEGKHYLVSEQAGGWFVRPDTRQRRQGLSGPEFERLWQGRATLDEKTAAEVSENIRRTREASRAGAA